MKAYWNILIAGKPVHVRVLRTEEERSTGYQHCEQAPAIGEGLLFLFQDERQRAFHMRNVPFDLDLIGFTKDGELACILPMKSSSPKVYSTPPCKFIVEVQKGFGSDLGDGCFLEIV